MKLRTIICILLLFLPLLNLANPICAKLYQTDQSIWNLGTVNQWKADVQSEVFSCQPSTCLVWPKSFEQKFNLMENNFIGTSASRLEKATHLSMREIEDNLSPLLDHASVDTAVAVEKRLLVQKQGVREDNADLQYNKSRLEKLWDKMKGKLDLTTFKIKPNVDYINEFESNFARLKEKYDSNLSPGEPELLTRDVMIGAGYSNLGSGLIITSSGQKYKRTQALDAFTLLHPLTDNAIDKGLDIKPSMRKITDFLDTGVRDTRTETRYEGLVLDLVAGILEQYPRDKHPLLLELLKETHSTQLKNAKLQKDPNTPIDKLIELSIHKGGVTVLSLLYILKGGLTREEAAFFYRQGALIQMGDDLVDITTDLQDGIRTVWTEAYRTEAGFKKTFQAFLNLQSTNERQVETIADADLRSGLRQDINLGFKMFMLSAFLNPLLESHVKKFMDDKIPLAPKNVRSIIFNSYYTLLNVPAGDTRLRKAIQFSAEVLDMHFLGNQYKKWEEKQKGKGKPFQIKMLNPSLLLLKVEQALTNSFQNRTSNIMTVELFTMIMSSVIMANINKGIPGADAWLATNGTIAVMSAIYFAQNVRDRKYVRLPAWAWLGTYINYIGLTYYQNYLGYFQ